MSERFEIGDKSHGAMKRWDDKVWYIFDNSTGKQLCEDNIKGVAEQVKKALDEAINQEVEHE